jgi:hypothetical protein
MVIGTTVRLITMAVIGPSVRVTMVIDTTIRVITSAIVTTDTGTIGRGITGTATTVHAGTIMAATAATGFAGDQALIAIVRAIVRPGIIAMLPL